ncbi:MAG: tetratricopeptide repeat protein [Saprospiraceae bacterium]|nr:tetratricopeptide repeat protein [Saprospiraceae bacterium]
MTPRNLLLLLLVMFGMSTTAQQVTLQGRVSLHNSKYSTGEIRYVDNAQVMAAFTAPSVTDNEGSFTLEFVGLDGGTSVSIDIDKNDLEVVNKRDLDDVVIGRKTPLRIYMASKGQLLKSQTEIYQISLESLNASHNRRIEQLKSESAEKDALIADLQEEFGQELKDQYEAIELLESQLAEVKKQLVPMAQELAYVNLDFASDLYIEAYEHFRSGDIEKAIAVLDDAQLDQAAADAFVALDVAERISGKAQQELQGVVDGYKLKSKAYALRFEYRKAAEALEKAIAIQKKGLRGSELVNLLVDVTDLYNDMARHDTALARMNTALEIQTKELPESAHGLSITHDRLSGIHVALGDYEKGLDHAQQSLTLAQEVLAGDHPDLAEAHASLSVAYGKLKKLEEAMTHQREVIRIRSKIEDLKESKLGNAFNQMAVLQGGLGRYDSALHYLHKALDIENMVLEPNDPTLSRTYSNLGTMYLRNGDFETGLQYHERALQLRKEMLEAGHPMIAMSHINVAVAHRTMARAKGDQSYLDTALTHTLEGIRIFESAYKPEHPRLASVYSSATTIYQSLGRYEEAITYAMKGLDNLKQRVEPNHPDFATAYNNISRVYSGMGDFETALEYAEKTIEIDEATLPPDHPYLSISYNGAATICMKTEEYKRALDYAEKGIEVNINRKPGRNLLASYRLAACANERMGKTRKAEEYHALADEVREALGIEREADPCADLVP